MSSKERGTRLFEQLESLRGQVTGALKWLLSDDPLNRVHAKDILLMALGETEREFAEKWKDHIIQPSPNETKAGATVTIDLCETCAARISAVRGAVKANLSHAGSNPAAVGEQRDAAGSGTGALTVASSPSIEMDPQ